MKTKRTIGIIIAAVVLLVAGLIAYAFVAPKSIEGEWELIVNPEIAQSTPDEAEKQDRGRVYYIFSQPGTYGDGTYKTLYDGGVEEGTYKLSEKDGKQYINLGTEDLAYTVTGSQLFGRLTLTITYPAHTDETAQTTDDSEYVFARSKAPDYERQCYDAYDTDASLLAQWVTNERTLSYYVYEIPYIETVTFTDNGIMTIRYESADLLLDRTMYYAYTAQSGALEFSLVTDPETRYTVDYEITGDGELVFKDDQTDASIFADAFFGDAVYYPPDDLPESETGASSQEG